MKFIKMEYHGNTSLVTAVTTNRVLMEPEEVVYLKGTGHWYLMTLDPKDGGQLPRYDRVGPVAAARLDAWFDISRSDDLKSQILRAQLETEGAQNAKSKR